MLQKRGLVVADQSAQFVGESPCRLSPQAAVVQDGQPNTRQGDPVKDVDRADQKASPLSDGPGPAARLFASSAHRATVSVGALRPAAISASMVCGS